MTIYKLLKNTSKCKKGDTFILNEEEGKYYKNGDITQQSYYREVVEDNVTLFSQVQTYPQLKNRIKFQKRVSTHDLSIEEMNDMLKGIFEHTLKDGTIIRMSSDITLITTK